MSSKPAVLLWAYPSSPFAQKLQRVLELKGISYSYCTVTRMPPRPALQQLGITYRRIPVLAIGADVYFDTSLAVVALEEAFPEVSLKGRSWPVQLAAGLFWSDRQIFTLAAALIPWHLMPADFIKDRGEYRGGPGAVIDVKGIERTKPKTLSALRQHMALIETQLESRSSPSNFILDSETPIYLDLTLFFVLNWISTFGTADSIFKPASGAASSPFKLTLAWLDLIRKALAKAVQAHPQGGVPEEVSNDVAAQLVLGGKFAEASTRVDPEEPLLTEKWLAIGDMVEVTPSDTGKVPQKGKLIGLNAERVTIEVKGENGGVVRVHAPRIAFEVKKV